jgi:hypothetical protein
MLKWFNDRSEASMRGLAFAAALIAALAVTGCDRRDSRSDTPSVRPSTVVEPETRVDAVPQEEPAVARSQWRAVSDNARQVVGNLRVSLERSRGGPVVFAFANGVTVTAQPISVVAADSRSGAGGQSFAALMGGDPRVEAYLYRVQAENLTRSATQGGLCGADTTRHLAVSEFVDSSGRWVFKIAAFKSEAPPGVAGEDPLFCSAYAFASQ